MSKSKLRKILGKIRSHWSVSLTLRGFGYLRELTINRILYWKEYRSLRRFKDIHKGKRCFIVATGPSLTLEDVNKLKGEICFGMNSVFKLFEKTTWRPNYYIVVDSSVYKRIKNDIKEIDVKECFCPNESEFDWNKKDVNRLPYWNNWCRNGSQRRVIPASWREKKFSNDISNIVHQGTTVVYTIMQIAFYMGFKEIYLLGTDCNYSGTAKHSNLTSYDKSSKLDNSPEDLYEGMMDDYEKCKIHAEKKRIKIFNATRGGMLEKFPRVDLDNIILKN